VQVSKSRAAPGNPAYLGGFGNPPQAFREILILYLSTKRLK
jgi:hypothetical protein